MENGVMTSKKTIGENRVLNFSAGPAALPYDVLQTIQQDLFSYHGSGMSIMEMSHRGKVFIEVAQTAEQDLRDILAIPDNYKVLFMQGGGRAQYSMVPLNLLRDQDKADYVYSGLWSGLSIEEAKRYCCVNLAASAEPSNFTSLPAASQWSLDRDSAYLHYVDNETVHGLELQYVPETDNVPLVCDMSSNLLSRPVDVSRFGCIYACAQKNVGISGLTIVIVREDLLGDAMPMTPFMYNYENYAKQESMCNTPPTFAWYVAGLIFKWIKANGGLAKQAEINESKSSQLYTLIDSTDFYQNHVEPQFRSRMNVVFTLPSEELTSQFLAEAEQQGLSGLKGHRAVGGIRASIYNAIDENAVATLASFMRHFEQANG